MCDINASVSSAKALLPFKLLDAATSTGPGSPVDLGGVADVFTMQTVNTGSPDTVSLNVQGSVDGVNFFNLSSLNSNSGPGTNGPSSSTGSRFLVRYVRANLTALTGGTSPTVTVWLAPGPIL